MKTAGRGKVLIVAYQFPPLGGVGPQRALSLCRYLPEFGVEVHVYDPELTPLCTPKPRESTDKIVVTYLGTVYKPNSPVAYLDALDAVPEEIRSRFVTRFIGRIAPEMADSFRGRRSEVEVYDLMPQKDALRFLAGALVRVLRETGAGWSADPGEPECVANLIRNAYWAWVERRPFVPDRSAIERYDRRKLAGKFAEPICHLEN